MADIAPLTPLRYDLSRVRSDTGRGAGLGSLVSPPYDVISPEERTELASRDPHNVVRLILPEGEGDTRYAHAAKLFSDWQNEGVLMRDTEPAFYRYDQSFQATDVGIAGTRTITRRGFLALVRLAPFSERIVLPHERTLSGPKEDRLKLFRATGANLSPGFMLYRDPRGELDAPLDTGDVLAQFNTPDGIHHVLAKVTGRDAVRAIIAGIAKSSLLIADGHHRYETAIHYRDEILSAHPDASPKAETRYFMAFLVNGDDRNLVVFPTHRHVHSLPSFAFDTLLEKAKDLFEIEALPARATADTMLAAVRGPVTLSATGSIPPPAPKRTRFVVAAGDQSALLTLRANVDLARHPVLSKQPDCLRVTDVAVLHGAILEHILGITPEAQVKKTNLWYPQDARVSLASLRAGKGQAIFLMNPTPVYEVREVAERGEVMPQKSTFFFPKVVTGLAIHTLDPNRFVPIVL